LGKKLSTYKNVHACTIVARNYLSAARVLAKSFLSIHEGATFTTLVLDDRAGIIDQSKEPFRVYHLEDIGLGKDAIDEMTAIYTVMELATAVKPWLLETLLTEAEAVLYLDPDIKVYSPLDELFLAAMEGKIVLTPHAVKPMPRDNKTTDETAVLASGIYNLGFIGLGQREDTSTALGTNHFLSFWQERLQRECYVDIANMRFVDQRWIDFVPGIYEVAIIKNPVYNVAYWNLDHREIGFSDNHYTVNGKPLAFFHFSGYNPHTPHLLSKHQGERPRILFSEHPYLKELCDEYGRDLLSHGFDTTTKEPYLYDRLGNGIKLDQFSRRLYRNALLQSKEQDMSVNVKSEHRDSSGHLPESVPSPFSGNGDEFVIWLNNPPKELSSQSSTSGAADNKRVRLYNNAHPSRYLLAIHQARADLQIAFPDPLGNDQYRLVEWADHEAASGRLDQRLVPGSPAARELIKDAGEQNSGNGLSTDGTTSADIPARGPEDNGKSPSVDKINPDNNLHHELVPGMRVTGYFRAETGTGEHARLVLSAIERAGIPAGAHVDTNMVSRQEHLFSVADREDLNVNVICINADQLPYFAEDVGEQFFKGRYNIGLWAWELEEFPEHFAKAASYLDEIWANSAFTQKAISQVTDKLVFPFPLPVKEPFFTKKFDRKRLNIGSETMFLFCFDLMSVMERKNPLGLIKAFSMAFKDGEGPKLVIKAVGGKHKLADLEKLKYLASKRKDIVIFDSYLSFEENAALIDACDCYVSLHRSEGFGLTMAEAMALGKPVIATKYSGNLDFMTVDNSFLVPFDRVHIPPGCDPYPTSMFWAEPDLEAAAAHMRDVVEKPEIARNKGLLAKDNVLQLHGLEARAQFVRDRFEFAQSQIKLKGIEVSVDKVNTVDIVREPPLIALAKANPDFTAPTKKGKLAKVYRKAVYKALRHHDDRQKQLDVAMASGIEHVARLITEYGQEITNLHSEISELQTQVFDDTPQDDGRVIENSRQTRSNLSLIKDLEAQISEVRALLYGQRNIIQSQEDKFDSGMKQLLTLQDDLDALEANFSYLNEQIKLVAGPEKKRQLLEISKALEKLKHSSLFSAFYKPGALIKGIDGFETLGFDRSLLQSSKSYLEIIDDILGMEKGKKKRHKPNTTDVFAKADENSNSLWGRTSLWGNQNEVLDRQQSYLKILSSYEHVIDLGCGQGELLLLLRENGIDASGIDQDPDLTKHCRKLGLEVNCADFREYLKTLPNDLQTSIVVANVMQYLTQEEMTSFITTIENLLAPGYMLIIEMRNPHQIRSFIDSWAEPKVHGPIFPEALLIECHAAGFKRAELFFPSGTGDYQKDLAEQEYYAVLAYK